MEQIGLDERTRRGALGPSWGHLLGVLDRYAERFIALYRENLEYAGRNASRALSDSLSYEVRTEARTIGVDISLLDYWTYIEHGTAPHWAPIQPLRDWVRVKGLAPRPRTGAKVPGPINMEKEINRIAHAVQWKIAQEGTEGKPNFQSALDAAWAEFEDAIGEAISADIGENIDVVLAVLAQA